MSNEFYIPRKLEGEIKKYINSPEIIAVMGPRQVGKTTMLKNIFKNLKNNSKAEFITFEDKKILNLFNKDIDSFIDIYIKPNSFLFIDEFQYAEEGGQKLKYIFDTNKTKIFISGSSSIDLSVKAIKFLVGRIFIFELYQLDFEEFLSFKNEKYSKELKAQKNKFKSFKPVQFSKYISDKLKAYYEEYAIYGGYPRVVIAKDIEEKKEVLRNIYNTYFLREVKDILGLIDDYKLSKLIRALSLQTSNLIEYKELGRISDYPHNSLKKYMNFLEKTFICSFVKPYYKNKRIEIVKNPKIYFYDTGLRNSIIEDFRGFDERTDAGALLENAVFQQLIKGGYNVNFWRSKKQYEIDFVLPLKEKKTIAIEVKKYLKTNSSTSVKNFTNTYPNIDVFFVYLEKDKKINNDSCFPVYVV